MSRAPAGPPTHFLSHVLGPDTPAYGGGEGFHATPLSEIAAGGTANSSLWHFPNHLGTHLDAPRHFVDGGSTVDSYGPDAWWFGRPVLVDVPTADDALIVPADVSALIPLDADLVLLRTGFEAHRGTERFWARNPGLTAELGRWFRAERPSVRAVGMDLISVTGRAHRAEGRLAHRAFLDENSPGRAILLIEDMALATAPTDIGAILVSPLRVIGADGGPCAVFGWIGT